ncbi:MAG: hypothetical protein U0790_12210 [Isosphaeraceae bacterium]
MSAWAFSRARASQPAWRSSSCVTSSMTCSWLRFEVQQQVAELRVVQGLQRLPHQIALHLVELLQRRLLILRQPEHLGGLLAWASASRLPSSPVVSVARSIPFACCVT